MRWLGRGILMQRSQWAVTAGMMPNAIALYADANLMDATQTKWTNSVQFVAKRADHCGKEDAAPRSAAIVAH
jgi:hypothetical protein